MPEPIIRRPVQKGIEREKADELIKRFSGTSVGIAYDEGLSEVTLSLPVGRDTRSASFRVPAELDAAAKLPLESLHLVGDYAAICSYSEGFIEALIEPIYPPAGYLQHTILFGVAPFSGEAKKPIVVSSDTGVTITLQLASDYFKALSPLALGFNRNMLRREGLTTTMRISNIRFSTNEEANVILRKTADAVFLQIDLIAGVALGLTRVRERRPDAIARTRREKVSETLQFPTHEFHQEAMAYYWFARGARGASHFQFLSYYQVLEFYYAAYTHNEACKRVAQILKNPTFRADRETDIARILVATDIRQQASEREQLKLTLTSCVTAAEFRDWLSEDEYRTKALTTKEGQSISKHLIPIKDTSANLLEVAALRVYDIRCRIVHTGAEAPTQASNILPYSSEAKQLKHDIEMTAFLSRKVLIANAAPIHITPTGT